MWGPYPNNAWGHGKVNAFEALTTCSLNVNVNEIEGNNNSCNIFPNPASTTLFVQINGSQKNIISIYDVQGRMTFQSEFNSNNFSIPLSTMNEGVYFLKVQTESNGIIMKRFVIVE